MKKNLAFIALGLLLTGSASAQTERSLNDYQDLGCQELIVATTTDGFINFARQEITSMIEADYCELRMIHDSEKDFEGAEADRHGVSDAAHSKLIEALYLEYLGL